MSVYKCCKHCLDEHGLCRERTPNGHANPCKSPACMGAEEVG